MLMFLTVSRGGGDPHHHNHRLRSTHQATKKKKKAHFATKTVQLTYKPAHKDRQVPKAAQGKKEAEAVPRDLDDPRPGRLGELQRADWVPTATRPLGLVAG